MPVTLVKSRWSSGSLIFHEDGNLADTGNVLTLAQGAVTIGNASNDVDFTVHMTGAKTFVIDYGAATIKSGVAILPAASDGAALGSATLMWCDLFLASGGVINFDNGDVTLTHAANILRLTGGALNTGIDGSGVDLKMFGDTESCYAQYDASEDQFQVVQTNAATSGTERSATIGQTHTGVGAAAEALAVTLTSNVALGSYANAIFGKIDLQTTGLISGLAGVVCAELTMPGGTIAGGAGTYACFEAEINCPTGYDSTVPIAVFSINAWGAAVGKFDDSGYLFDLTGVTSGAAHIWYDNQKAAPAVEEFIRVRTPAGDRFLGLYNANA